LVGLQAQAPVPPYFGLWSRLTEFRPEQLSRLLESRAVVRIVLMRGTIHLVSAADCLFLRSLVQPALTRSLSSSVYSAQLAGLDPVELADEGRALLTEQPMSPAELGAAMTRRWPDRDPLALANAVRTHVPLVQVPPPGLWGRSGAARHAPATHWLGAPLLDAPSAERLVLRYLAAFGPASVADAQAWSGLTRLGEIVDRLRPGLTVFRDERGAELFDVPQARRPDPDTPAPVRFLPHWEASLLVHARRTGILPEEYRSRVFSIHNPFSVGTYLVDGRVEAEGEPDAFREHPLVLGRYLAGLNPRAGDGRTRRTG